MSALSLRAKMLVTVAAVGSTAAVAGLGTFGTFTSTTSASTAVDTGVVSIVLGTADTAANRLSVAATDIVPGDTVQRAFTLSNGASTSPLGAVTLTTTAPAASSSLNTETANGLQLVIDRCSLAAGWTEAGTAGAYTYTCPSGTVTTVLASVPVIGSARTLTGLSSLSTGATDSLRATLTLPAAAGNEFQNLASTVRLDFTATQRTSTDK